MTRSVEVTSRSHCWFQLCFRRAWPRWPGMWVKISWDTMFSAPTWPPRLPQGRTDTWAKDPVDRNDIEVVCVASDRVGPK